MREDESRHGIGRALGAAELPLAVKARCASPRGDDADRVLRLSGRFADLEVGGDLGGLRQHRVAEQYLSFESLIARSTCAAREPVPVTMKWKMDPVNTFGSSAARSESSSTTQSVMGCRALRRMWTTSIALQAPVPIRTSSMGLAPRSRPRDIGRGIDTTAWPLPLSARTSLRPPT
jgi:hypothetical protein